MKPADPKSDSAIRAAEKLPPQSALRTALTVLVAVADVIREVGEIPSGHLYAAMMTKIDLLEYERIIDVLVKAELITRDRSHMLRWIGPKEEALYHPPASAPGAED